MRRLLVIVATGAAIAAGVAVASSGSAGAPAAHDHGAAVAATYPQAVADALAKARLATAKYLTDPARARRDGYTVTVTRMVPDMAWHFMNPKITGFDPSRPPILMYVKRGGAWQLVGFEWVFPERPKKAPLPGATYGSFPAACHYADGTFAKAASQDDCAATSPQTGAAFGFWHPDLVTLHLWAWYPNPDGIYSGTNRLVRPFNRG